VADEYLCHLGSGPAQALHGRGHRLTVFLAGLDRQGLPLSATHRTAKCRRRLTKSGACFGAGPTGWSGELVSMTT
jgi:hypothetical protein